VLGEWQDRTQAKAYVEDAAYPYGKVSSTLSLNDVCQGAYDWSKAAPFASNLQPSSQEPTASFSGIMQYLNRNPHCTSPRQAAGAQSLSYSASLCCWYTTYKRSCGLLCRASFTPSAPTPGHPGAPPALLPAHPTPPGGARCEAPSEAPSCSQTAFWSCSPALLW